MWFKKNIETRNVNLLDRVFNTSSENSEALKESTYLRCIKYLSESIAKMPLVIKQETKSGEIEATHHRLYDTLKLRPNDFMSASIVKRSLIALGEHKGVAGLYIHRTKKVIQLYPVEIVQIVVDDVGLIKSDKENKVLVNFMSVNGETGSCLEKDIIIYRGGLSLDGINTKSNLSYLNETIATNQKSQNYLNELFDNGLTNKMIVQMTSDIKNEAELKSIQEKFKRLYASDGRVFTIPAGFNVSALNLSLADSQFEQLRKLSRREIANVFGLTNATIGDLEDSNNNNMEMQNLSILIDTLLPRLTQLEEELDFKLLSEQERKQGYKIRFNQNVLLRVDSKTQAEIVCKYVQNGIYSPNEARKILGFTTIEGGEDLIVSSGTLKMKNLGNIGKEE